MRVTSPDQLKHWLRSRHIGINDDGEPWLESAAGRLSVKYPERVTDRHYLVRGLVLIDSPFGEGFAGGMVGISDWDIWDSSVDEVGRALYGHLAGDNEPVPSQLPDGPCAFDASQEVECLAMASLMMMYDWDGWFVPDRSGFIVRLSHEGYATVICRTERELQIGVEMLEPFHPELYKAGAS